MNNSEIDIHYRNEMKNFVNGISKYAKTDNSNFLIIPQNGFELLTDLENPSFDYIESIDGIGCEDYKISDLSKLERVLYLLDFAEDNNIEVLTTDYYIDENDIDRSYSFNNKKGYVFFNSLTKELNTIPLLSSEIFNENTKDIVKLSDVENFLYIINPELYDTNDDLIKDLSSTNYDLIILDLFNNQGNQLSFIDVFNLKKKANGASRLIIAYMSIGEAEEYRYYWDPKWSYNSPDWLESENSSWPGNYKVRYWYKSWQDIIYGNDYSYLDKIINSGFDGVYLDIVDGFEYFESPY